MITVHVNPLHSRPSPRDTLINAMAVSAEKGSQTIETSCELFILAIKARVRHQDKLRSNDIQFTFEFFPNTVIELDAKGEFIQPWPDNLFDIGFNLVFSKDKADLLDVCERADRPNRS